MLPYYPGLRFKQGEYSAMAKLPKDIQCRVEPRFIVPPPKDFDPELGRPPTFDEIAHVTGERIGKHWPFNRAFLDTQFIAADIGESGLLTLFRLAQKRNPKIVPVASLRDLHNQVFRMVQCDGTVKLAVLISFEEANPEIISSGLKAAGLSAADCILFVDFTGASLDPEIAAGSIAGIFELLYGIGQWQRIVFQGSNFPAKNPADHGKDKLIPRDEWTAFHAALKECNVPPEKIGYGDFAADSGEMNFPRGKGGGRPIRHLRYTLESHTLIVRAGKDGSDTDVMREVCQRILDCEQYAGQAFSEADDRIYRVAKSMEGPGTSSMWREWNTIHHITRVVNDLGTEAGISFRPGQVSIEPRQASFFDDVKETVG